MRVLDRWGIVAGVHDELKAAGRSFVQAFIGDDKNESHVKSFVNTAVNKVMLCGWKQCLQIKMQCILLPVRL